MKRQAAALLLASSLLACADGGGDSALQRDSLTRRQRDSVIANSKLPGAGGVKGALNASDAAAVRQQAMDTIR
jgi:hypothetical protein